jgi:hypothetical protein
MSRRRSADPTDSIRITIPRSIHNNILGVIGSGSRSAWISAACLAQLNGGGTYIADASDKQLLVTLLNRGLITRGLFDELMK